MNKPLAISLEFCNLLEKNNINYCYWKCSRDFSSALAGAKDIDMLVDKNQASECEQILLNLGFKRVISQSWARFPGIEDWLAVDEVSGKLIHVHLHYQLLSGLKFVKEQVIPWEKIILETVVKDTSSGVALVDPNLELILLAVRIGGETTLFFYLSRMFQKTKLPKKFSGQRNYLLGRINEAELHRWGERLFSSQNGPQIISLISKPNLKLCSIIRLRILIAREMSRYRRHRKVPAIIIQMLCYFYVILLKLRHKIFKIPVPKKRFHNSGFIIAVIGCDGSGKSTITTELARWFSSKLEVKKLYLGSGDGLGPLFRGLKILVRRFKGIKRDGVKTKKISKTDTSISLPAYLWKAYIASMRYRKIIKAKMAGCSAVVITDRYPQKQFNGIYDGPSLQDRKGLPVIYQFLAKYEQVKYKQMDQLPPDILIKLHLTPETAVSRKPDHTLSEVKAKAVITPQIYYPGTRIINIDASEPLEMVVKKVKTRVWELL
ncbi:hypothetical protein MFMK1_001277 [Metallumcola ferriviriculae]|uniref:Thymidylate kinase n=1 Tax=Metallumcola ferriviriculae TaxID=3039180 RepID=A0AAU0UNR3_9FIRM|nr:hypothetical protein MFMK1_001277 [Desulfitibacteraceae bacterium MK1]